LNIKVSQGRVATHLRCDGIFNDQFITLSLLSSTVKKTLKIDQHLPKLWAIKYRVVFYETRCILSCGGMIDYVRGLGAEYFSRDFRLVSEIHSCQRQRSASSTDVVVPATSRSSLGDRAFPVAGARTWNALPPSVTSAPSLSSFRRLLKTFLFQRQRRQQH